MDILDIDEVLNDDSFCLMEDSEHDDVSNILQQWRQNGGTATGDGKLDTRTFTRPRRRSAQNMESNFTNVVTKSGSPPQTNQLTNIHLKIGGLVTSMQKSFLQDTSPPSSISSSMDASSMDRMGSSLINSADFTNVSFFKTTDAEDVLSGAQITGYNFDDVIKDRKALENLSLSGDSAIIKDCNIAQIDEMTYLSKTNSGNSTMQNSTESMASALNETFPMLNQTTIENNVPISKEALSSKDVISRIAEARKSSIVRPGDDLISNTTISLIDSTHIMQQVTPETEMTFNLTFDKMNFGDRDETFLKETLDRGNTTFEAINPVFCPVMAIMNRTYYKQKENETFNLSNENLPSSLANESKDFDSPTVVGAPIDHTVQSTPHRNASIMPSVVSQTPSIKTIIKEVNLSPIVSAVEDNENEEEIMTEPVMSSAATDEAIDKLDDEYMSLSSKFPSFEEQIENFRLEKSLQNDALTNVECFENGIELLKTERTEEEFDDMLENFSRNVCLNESLKMRQSLDNIKKKHALSIHDKNYDLLIRSSDIVIETNRTANDNLCKSSLSSSSSSERLLSRRSRLYDDVAINKMPSENPNKTVTIEDSTKAIAKTENPIESKTEERPPSALRAKSSDQNNCDEAVQMKMRPERTKRDPERFRTIKIFKKETDENIIVPCIDDEIENADERQSESPTIENTVFNNNKSEVEPNQMYQTYRKSKPISQLIEPGKPFGPIAPHPHNQLSKPRSLSRPKYFSGIARRESEFSDALPKANSASDIHRTPNRASIDGGNFGCSGGLLRPARNSNNFSTGTKAGSDLKSPMGTKAKSFTNLTGSPLGLTSKLSTVAISKPGSQPSLMQTGTLWNREKTSQNDRNELNNRPTLSRASFDGVEKIDKTSFKMPQPVSNLRQPNSRRTGLMRPSSGYYGLTSFTARNDPDNETGRYSSNNSLSSASSRGSVNESSQLQQKRKLLNGFAHENNTTSVVEENRPEPLTDIMSETFVEQPIAAPAAPTAVKKSIPKPSGLRQPSSTARRSGLPRPSSLVRR